MFLYQILAYIIHGKIQKGHIRTINLKYQLQYGMKNLNYLIDKQQKLLETIKLLGSTKSKITKTKMGKMFIT